MPTPPGMVYQSACGGGDGADLTTVEELQNVA